MKHNGVRGLYGSDLITEKVYYQIPFMVREYLGIKKLAIAHDPRPSSQSLYQSLKQGAKDAGLQVFSGGMLPTPIIAKWCYDNHMAGLVVTASHNPVSDNGLKALGFSFPEAVCQDVKQLVLRDWQHCSNGEIQDSHALMKEAYVRKLKIRSSKPIDCVIDAASGAWAYHLDVLEAIGVHPTPLYPINPHQINTSGCVGITTRITVYEPHPLVVCFDGDGDRLNIVANGQLLDGDDILLQLSRGCQQTAVVTEMANQALLHYFKRTGKPYAISKVGDHHVYALMQQTNARFGAEPCGHIIDIEWMPLSDPVYILAKLLQCATEYDVFKQQLDKAFQYHTVLPKSKDINQIKKKLSHPGVRTIIRHSQTEPIIRVMLEGDQTLIHQIVAEKLSDLV
ncbi:MAG: hypothetical protein VXW87_04235 [Pseudomonadota bacterium]|nr:hypothetical protein [Pseudomonadota bacterium]